ncbi:voltage-dependent calcium channel gamma-6 subunit [Ictalurus punctatus]|uniref:Voltage-dependent calcium channel gamma-6 subunit n=1 Tax=Ictalurus punctatus TaxID=7998 RepID=A0A2D0R6A9_ICTPU|nr:voltage-dependent calcium channel gamma-6 subunit [Ictalurus punctatus]XP_017326140.1 voltage-dependent calcium channel gamma-6 subunit [Ictalurus punctatus]XP_017326148.1 voltage-dependent calcium channel gamma-6 subunit [Ictalurus punctatus]XP_047011471.1 voltage-dependent calcium channel gamma-6 subunit [Ictalurus punctatus]XP_047011478.1 voltage-dependent calcium channel gamma-6 subunit [Ictalurus punctatus]XP_047011484.1 voltage-dependent calcium channel gamma-6 subunit [Ictalurus punc
MWSNYFMQSEDDARVGGHVGIGAGGGGGRSKTRARSSHMTEGQEGKIKMAFFVAIVGVTLTVLGVGAEFWVELAQPKHFQNNQSCQLVHYGLWKACTRTLWVSDIDPERDSCGPAELPGESNCTYFKFYTSGENAVIFKKTTDKNLSLASAMLAVFSLFLMMMGSVCIIMSLTKSVPFLLKPASVCFLISGILILLSILVFHQSVLALLASDHSVPLHYEFSWSVACVGSAGAILLVGGILFLLFSLPFNPFRKCIMHQNNSA